MTDAEKAAAVLQAAEGEPAQTALTLGVRDRGDLTVEIAGG